MTELYGNSRVVRCKSCRQPMGDSAFDLCADCALDALSARRVRPFPAEWAQGHAESVADAVGNGQPPLWVRLAEGCVVGVLRGMALGERVARRVRRIIGKARK